MTGSKRCSPEQVGKRIRLLRTALGLSQAEFGKPIKVSPSAVSNFERGDNRPGIECAAELCEFYGVTFDWLYLGRADTLQYRIARLLQAAGAEPPS